MENQTPFIGALFEKTEYYARASAELYKLQAIDKSADVMSTLATRVIILGISALFFLVLNVGIALWAGEMVGKSYFGFFIVAGFYAFAGVILYAFRNRWIRLPVRNSIIIQALN